VTERIGGDAVRDEADRPFFPVLYHRNHCLVEIRLRAFEKLPHKKRGGDTSEMCVGGGGGEKAKNVVRKRRGVKEEGHSDSVVAAEHEDADGNAISRSLGRIVRIV
jgi:hypothetical protein